MKKNFSFRGGTLTTTWHKGLLFLMPTTLFRMPLLKAQKMEISSGTIVVYSAKF